MTYKYHFLISLISLLSLNCLAAEQISDPTMPANYKVNKRVSLTTLDQSMTLLPPYEWVLNSTIISPYLKVAIINGKQLKIGEKINDATLEKIDHQNVELAYEGHTIILSLNQSFISKIKSSSQP